MRNHNVQNGEKGGTGSLSERIRAGAELLRRAPVWLFVCLLLLPWIGLGAIILSALNSNEHSTLVRAAETRAGIAASTLEQQIMSLIHTVAVASSASTPAIGTTELSAFAGTGIRILRPDTVLAETPLGTVDASDTANSETQAPAALALASKSPQVSTFQNGDDIADSGIDLWLPIESKGGEPAILQVHIPSSHLSKLLSGFVSDKKWSLALAGRDGRVFTEFGMKSDWSDGETSSSFARAFSEPSHLGLRVGAATSLTGVESDAQRNWRRFLVVTCLLSAATLAAGSTLTKRMSPDLDRRAPQNRTPATPETVATTTIPSLPVDARRRTVRNGMGEDRLRLALNAGGLCAWNWETANGKIIWDASCKSMLRLPSGSAEPTTKDLLRRLGPRDRQRLMRAVRRSLYNSQSFGLDVALRCFDGTVRWFAIHASPVQDRDGRLSGLVGVASDINEQKKNVSRTDSLLREVSHRSKNLLALILAMARLTARDSMDVKGYLKDFTLRVAGLAASQDLIVAADWQNVDMRTLASAQIEAVARADASRVRIAGPAFLLVPEAAQTLGMILTELALNAVEHGALSVATGNVNLSWRFPNPSTIEITWGESGGPAYNIQRPKGYGQAVIERFSTQGLKLESSLETGPSSFRWSLAGPIGNLGTAPTPPPASSSRASAA